MPRALVLEPRLAAIHAAEYPRFSEAEMARRRAALERTMQAAGADHLLVCGEQRAGTAVGWLTGWPTTVEAYAIVGPREPQTMFVEWYNHWPLAKLLARDTEVRWGEHRGIELVVAELKRRGAKRIGLIGPLGWKKVKKLEAEFGPLADLDRDYVRLRLVKSAEEIAWMRLGAALTDLGVEALREEARPGMSERELGAICEAAWAPHGGVTFIHYFLATPMSDPQYCVPRQIASNRRIVPGDVLACELTAHFHDYPGQLLRSFTVAAEPTPLFERLYRTAEAAFDAVTAAIRPGAAPADILEAAALIEEAGFTVWDDLVHGFGGGYLPPVLGSKSRPAGPLPEMTFEAGMTCVVQPNVVTRDGRAGVQVGELILVTERGCERLHRAERGFFRIG